MFDDGGGPALYAGGCFTTAGGVAANHIAKWDGSSWAALGSGVNDTVWALTVFDDGGGPALYAGGSFTSAGGVAASRIAKWDGSSWAALGSGIGGASPYVGALTVFDDGGGPALYAGGNFQSAGGVAAKRIAKWDGSSWAALGSGIGGAVVCPDGVRRRRRASALRRRRLHDRGRRGGERDREVGRLELGGTRQRDERFFRLRRCPDGVRRRRRAGALRRRQLHDRRRRGGEPDREVGRLELGGPRQRDERRRLGPDGVRRRQRPGRALRGRQLLSAIDSGDSYLAKWGCPITSSGIAYCTAGTTTNGCVPAISGTGDASASAGSGFTLSIADVEGQKSGLLFYGVTGAKATPWGAGTSYLCIEAPLKRMSTQNSGGTVGACDGVFVEDWNAYIAAHPAALGQPFVGGETVWAQGWFRDPPAPKSTNLSDALVFQLFP